MLLYRHYVPPFEANGPLNTKKIFKKIYDIIMTSSEKRQKSDNFTVIRRHVPHSKGNDSLIMTETIENDYYVIMTSLLVVYNGPIGYF